MIGLVLWKACVWIHIPRSNSLDTVDGLDIIDFGAHRNLVLKSWPFSFLLRTGLRLENTQK